MDAITPITKQESRKRNDQRAHSRYARRRDIDRLLEQRRLERELGRVVG
ncbi:hypothetical protein PRZ61_10700 [Halomonas pacifica]|nr:hypothetical protein [Halomonas pacifica]MDC8803904.1 hypothetical protein [Halomonas pacifica]